MAYPPPADNTRFEPFNITNHPYKVVNGQEIDLNVLIPKNIHTGKRPIIIHFHGGFLISGDAMFPDWAASWALNYQLQHSAIRISANYRLLPESNGLEILSDVRDLLDWVQNDLAAYLKRIGSDITPDLDQVIVYGESAGGYISLLSGLMKPQFIKAVIAAYPMTYIDSDWYSKASTDKSPFGTPQLPRKILDDHIAAIKPGSIVTKATPPARLPLGMVALQQGLFGELIGSDESLRLEKVLVKKSAGEKMPYLYIFHGKGDSAVPCEQSEQFLKEWKAKFGEDSAIGEFQEGEHGFDGESSLEDEWMQRGLTGVTKAWIG
ncbi:alpha/beta-hydrolase [Mollisia scopiformis]|uniref:Alpha/beta-hydrolase n=1 Tax=Mollisia scopiformis TaxID=149040 RepID=A0A194XB78_MOLSC|nr:alpha/beta-hydrolase [Mollisia scopiformis]KUJ17425.1 alpha/beta-hydrolase [Mollisia scopiformis]